MQTPGERYGVRANYPML